MAAAVKKRGLATARRVPPVAIAQQSLYLRSEGEASERRLQSQNSAKEDAGFTDQGGALDFGLLIRVEPCETASYLTAPECQIHADRISMLARE